MAALARVLQSLVQLLTCQARESDPVPTDNAHAPPAGEPQSDVLSTVDVETEEDVVRAQPDTLPAPSPEDAAVVGEDESLAVLPGIPADVEADNDTADLDDWLYEEDVRSLISLEMLAFEPDQHAAELALLIDPVMSEEGFQNVAARPVDPTPPANVHPARSPAGPPAPRRNWQPVIGQALVVATPQRQAPWLRADAFQLEQMRGIPFRRRSEMPADPPPAKRRERGGSPLSTIFVTQPPTTRTPVHLSPSRPQSAARAPAANAPVFVPQLMRGAKTTPFRTPGLVPAGPAHVFQRPTVRSVSAPPPRWPHNEVPRTGQGLQSWPSTSFHSFP